VSSGGVCRDRRRALFAARQRPRAVAPGAYCIGTGYAHGYRGTAMRHPLPGGETVEIKVSELSEIRNK